MCSIGGRIDHAHHDNYAANSLQETVALSDAVKAAVSLTDEADTLIVVSADHSHVFTINGYPYISNDILGKSVFCQCCGRLYMSLGSERSSVLVLIWTYRTL